MNDFTTPQNNDPMSAPFDFQNATVLQWLNSSTDLFSSIRNCHPEDNAAVFAGLLLNKDFHAHTLRLELLVHSCIAFGSGVQRNSEFAQKLFALAGKAIGLFEDPPENVFLGNIAYACGNARVLEGIWESGVFCLQRLVNIVDDQPAGEESFETLRASVRTLLKLSDALCDRAQLKRYELGGRVADEASIHSAAENTSALRQLVSFSADELKSIGVDVSALAVAKFLKLPNISVESHIVFSHTVPMQYSTFLQKSASIHALDELNLKP